MTKEELLEEWMSRAMECVWRSGCESEGQEAFLKGLLASYSVVSARGESPLQFLTKQMTSSDKDEMCPARLIAIVVIVLMYRPYSTLQDAYFWVAIQSIHSHLQKLPFFEIPVKHEVVPRSRALQLLYQACSRHTLPRRMLICFGHCTPTEELGHWMKIPMERATLVRNRMTRQLFVHDSASTELHQGDELLQLNANSVPTLSDGNLIKLIRSWQNKQNINCAVVYNPKDYQEFLSITASPQTLTTECKDSEETLYIETSNLRVLLTSDSQQIVKERRHSSADDQFRKRDHFCNQGTFSVLASPHVSKPLSKFATGKALSSFFHNKVPKLLHLQSPKAGQNANSDWKDGIKSKSTKGSLLSLDHFDANVRPPQCRELHHSRFRKISAHTTLEIPTLQLPGTNNNQQKPANSSYDDSALFAPRRKSKTTLHSSPSDQFDFNMKRLVTVHLIGDKSETSSHKVTFSQDALNLEERINDASKITRKLNHVSNLMKKRTVSTIEQPSAILLKNHEALDLAQKKPLRHASQDNLDRIYLRTVTLVLEESSTGKDLLERVSLMSSIGWKKKTSSDSFDKRHNGLPAPSYRILKFGQSYSWELLTNESELILDGMDSRVNQVLLVTEELLTVASSLQISSLSPHHEPIDFLDLNVQHLAAHLYAQAFVVLRNLQESDLIALSGRTGSPSAIDLSHFSNRLQDWVQKELSDETLYNYSTRTLDCHSIPASPLDSPTRSISAESCDLELHATTRDIGRQTRALRQFLSLCVILARLGDLESVFNIICNLDAYNFKQKSHVWNRIPKSLVKQFNPLRMYLDTDGNMRNLRTWHHELLLAANNKHFFPFIPVIGLLFKDLAVMDELEALISGIFEPKIEHNSMVR
ncbi:hypothetical protein Ciccas_005841 [Cichlidogyrus casuarinus]|uniref:Ras-GEF domain-containing protein n=1 Tax=Cichlidogyrus casuarinus TaxID=1844966 RepID=A0ABD2Q7I2_9PLAT